MTSNGVDNRRPDRTSVFLLGLVLYRSGPERTSRLSEQPWSRAQAWQGVQRPDPVGRLNHRVSVPLGVRLTPKGYAGWLDKLLARAGRPAQLPLDRLLIVSQAWR